MSETGKHYIVVDMQNFVRRAEHMQNGTLVVNFFLTLRTLVEEMTVENLQHHLIFCEEGAKANRIDLYEDYKANRKPKPQEFYDDIETIKQICLAAIPCAFYRHPEKEADDVMFHIASTTFESSNDDDRCSIVTADKDLYQVNAYMPKARVYHPIQKHFADLEEGYPYYLQKAVQGDKSDNIRPIPGMGPKKSERIARLSPAELDEYLGSLPPEHLDIFHRNYSLVKLNPLPPSEDAKITKVLGSKKFDWKAMAKHKVLWERVSGNLGKLNSTYGKLRLIDSKEEQET